MFEQKKLLVILGPTATGKTDLGLYLAKKFNGELVACDSRQLYKGLDIGTGKHPGKDVLVVKENSFWLMDGIKVWMYDVADPRKQYSVASYVKTTGKIIDDILERGKLPIIVGGTGLYLKALLEGLSNLAIPVNNKLRGELQTLNLNKLQQKLRNLSIERYEKLNESDRKNPRRLLRSIEIVTMYPYASITNLTPVIKNAAVLKIGLTASRDVLNKRIDSRVLSRLDQGMIKEGKDMHDKGLSFKRMKELGLEYRLIADFLEGKIKNMEEFILLLQIKIHQFAKRQMTWFRKDERSSLTDESIEWFKITDNRMITKVEKRVLDWYNS